MFKKFETPQGDRLINPAHAVSIRKHSDKHFYEMKLVDGETVMFKFTGSPEELLKAINHDEVNAIASLVQIANVLTEQHDIMMRATPGASKIVLPR